MSLRKKQGQTSLPITQALAQATWPGTMVLTLATTQTEQQCEASQGTRRARGSTMQFCATIQRETHACCMLEKLGSS